MKIIKFIVYGDAISRKNKIAINKYSHKPYMYKAADSERWENSVTGQALKYKPDKLISGEIKLGMKFYRSVPKSTSNKKRELMLNNIIRPAKKPDLDNLIKSLKDSLKGVFFVDDSQIIEYLTGTGKYYSEIPRVEIEVHYDT